MQILIPTWMNDTLQPVEKLRVHQLGLKHKAVSVFVMWGKKTLLQRRALSKYHTPGLWANACCTHPQWEEAPLDCANRRLFDELGITDLSPKYRQKIEYRADVGNNLIEHEVVDLFVATVEEAPTVNLNPDEVSDIRWVELSELKSNIAESPEQFTPWLKIYLSDHGDLILD